MEKNKYFQNIQFYLTVALVKDDETGDFTAYYVQFPDACAQGRNEKEAIRLLDEIFPHLLNMKKEEFVKYHTESSTSVIVYKDRQMINA